MYLSTAPKCSDQNYFVHVSSIYCSSQEDGAELPRPSTATPDGEREEEGSSPELPHKERDMLDIKWKSVHHRRTTQVCVCVCVCVCVYM